MAFDSFGYNGVFGITQRVVNKVLAAQVYDPNLVGPQGQVPDGDFVGPISVVTAGGKSFNVYLLLGKPTVEIKSHDGTNLIAFTVPLMAIGLFELDGTGVAVRMSLSAQGQPPPQLGITLGGLNLQQSDRMLQVDMSKVGPGDISIDSMTLHPGLTGVGGTGTVTLALDDATIDALLKANNVTFTAKDLRTTIAAKVAAGALGPPTQIPLTVGGSESFLGKLDLFLFDGDDDTGGADLLLFNVDGAGEGDATTAADTIPPSSDPPPFGFAASLRADVVKEMMERVLDAAQYFKQGGTLNTPANPTGFLVVPGSGSRTFSLPCATNAVTVSAPAGGNVTVSVAKGGLPSRARCHLDLLGNGTLNRSVVNDDGSLTLTVAASAGDRLAFTLDAIPSATDPDTIVWRPQVSFKDGSLQIDVHFYHYIKNWCDVEGDASVEVALRPDPSAPFRMAADVLNSRVNVSAWWLDLLDFFGGFLVPELANPVVQIAFFPIIDLIAKGILDPQLHGALAPQIDQLNQKFSAALPPNVALFLEQVDVSTSGIVLSGYADAGRIVSFDRALIGQGALFPKGGPSYSVEWANDLATPGGLTAIHSGDARTDFWSSSYDERPPDSSFAPQQQIPIPVGASAMLWSQTPDGHAKVLLERPVANFGGLLVKVSWIEYKRRATRDARIAPNLVATKVGESGTAFFHVTFKRYDGTIGLRTTKMFFTDDTLASGDEQWFWDGTPVDDVGFALVGGWVKLDRAKHRLDVHQDQTQVANPDTGAHTVRFVGTDVFGTHKDTSQVVLMPWRELRVFPYGFLGPPWYNPLGPDPGPEIAQLAAEIAANLGNVGQSAAGAALATALATAIQRGAAVIDAGSAQVVVQGLAGRSGT